MNSRRAERYRQQQVQKRRKLIVGIGAIVVVVGVIVAFVVASGGDDNTPAVAGSTVTLSLSEYAITGNLEVPAGEVRLEATNVGGLPHNVGIRGGKITRNLQRGETATLVVTATNNPEDQAPIARPATWLRSGGQFVAWNTH